jgi:hypothetical protein
MEGEDITYIGKAMTTITATPHSRIGRLPRVVTLSLRSTLAQALDAGLVRDAVLVQSVADARALWAVRECTAELPARMDPVNFDDAIRQLSGRAERRPFEHVAQAPLELIKNYHRIAQK